MTTQAKYVTRLDPDDFTADEFYFACGYLPPAVELELLHQAIDNVVMYGGPDIYQELWDLSKDLVLEDLNKKRAATGKPPLSLKSLEPWNEDED